VTPPLTRAPARKSLGQHFLHDPDLLRRIALCGGPVEGLTVIEVGPGPGGLTRALLDRGVAHLIAIELDERFAEALKVWPEVEAGRLSVHKADALEADEAALIRQVGGAPPARIVANLPYNVATPLLIKWLKASDWRADMVLMFQKEVAQRVCASPGDDAYGRLAVISQAVMRPRLSMVIPAGAFRPPPKVESAVVVLTPLPPADRFGDLDALEIVTAAAFGQRRKMLRASLRSLVAPLGLPAEELLLSVDIDPQRRAETLSQPEFRKLARAWRERTFRS
jgi:16S rRNA (adenine1518-N6/adenine1519-N6)-dimethyltransferase